VKVGDLVYIDSSAVAMVGNRQGLIVDALEMSDGFFEFEIMLDTGETVWYSDISLKVVDEDR
jgi:hypothetical protein